MRQNTLTSRARYVQFGVPAAALGALATAISAVPAHAAPAHAAPPVHIGSDSTLSGLPGIVPASTAPTDYTVQDGDTAFSIAQRFGLRTVDVLTWNGLGWRSVIYPGQSLSLVAPAAAPATAAPATATHTVATGDTIFAIAQKYGTSVDTIYAANGLGSASIIYPGQTILVSAPAPVAPAAPAPAASTPLPAKTATLNAAQAENAGMIIRVGRELGVSDRGIAIALATSMVESWLRNLDWGDRDSLGLFQQRPSTGWGSAEQIMDRDRSIRVFYGGPSDPNGTASRGLLDFSGWDQIAFQDAAQAVQISAYPQRYGQWEAQAYQWIALYG